MFPIARTGDSMAGWGAFTVSIDGSKFRYTDAATEKEARRQAEEHALKIQGSLQGRLGRALTDEERLSGGLRKPPITDDESRAQRKKWEALLKKPDPGPQNPHLPALAAHKEELARDADPEGYRLQRAAEKWEADRQAAIAKDIRESDERYIKATGDSRSLLIATKYHPLSSAVDVDEVSRIDDYLRSGGDISTAVKMANDWKSGFADRLKKDVQPMIDQTNLTMAEIRELKKPLADVPAGQDIYIVKTGETNE
jgi:hypothetical protein